MSIKRKTCFGILAAASIAATSWLLRSQLTEQNRLPLFHGRYSPNVAGLRGAWCFPRPGFADSCGVVYFSDFERNYMVVIVTDGRIPPGEWRDYNASPEQSTLLRGGPFQVTVGPASNVVLFICGGKRWEASIENGWLHKWDVLAGKQMQTVGPVNDFLMFIRNSYGGSDRKKFIDVVDEVAKCRDARNSIRQEASTDTNGSK